MKSQIQSALDGIVGNVATLKEANGGGRAFELFVMTQIAMGLKHAGFNVWIQRSDGNPIIHSDTDRKFIQRGGRPGPIPPVSKGPNNASSILFKKTGSRHEWEIWNGIPFIGRSSATHEIDIAIVHHDVGKKIIASGGHPTGRPRVSIECKDLGTVGELDEVRAFIARLYDTTFLNAHYNHLALSPRRVIHPGSPNTASHEAATTFHEENSRTKNLIAHRTGFRPSAARLSTYYQIELHANIKPGSPAVSGLVSSVVNWAATNA